MTNEELGTRKLRCRFLIPHSSFLIPHCISLCAIATRNDERGIRNEEVAMPLLNSQFLVSHSSLHFVVRNCNEERRMRNLEAERTPRAYEPRPPNALVIPQSPAPAALRE